jgi:translation initiation factor 2B subunit (eIF-2B alpha/beta/delta family)
MPCAARVPLSRHCPGLAAASRAATQFHIQGGCRQNPSSISLKAGCDLFLRYTTRTSALENENFAATKARLIERGNQFTETSSRARSAIADVGSRFLTNGCTVLCHGFSRVIMDILRRARAQGAHFSVLITEGRPGEAAVHVAQELVPAGIDTTIILDSAAAYHMDRCACGCFEWHRKHSSHLDVHTHTELSVHCRVQCVSK